MSKGETRIYTEETTQFLNVDVEIRSRTRLDALAAALPSEVQVHYVGKARGVQFLSFSLLNIGSKSSNTKLLARRLDTLARRLADILSDLRPPARALWDGALSRTFDVGIQAGRAPHVHGLCLEPQTICMLAALAARIAITTYGADVREAPFNVTCQGPNPAA